MKPVRRTAYKLWISNMLNSEKEVDAGKFIGLNVKINDKPTHVSRVNLIANVIDKFVSDKGNFASLTLDDSSGNIRLKVFNPNLINDFNIGHTVLVVGQLRLYNNEVYIAPEIIKHVEPLWLLARKLELEKLFGLKLEQQPMEMQTRQVSEAVSETSKSVDKTFEVAVNAETENSNNIEVKGETEEEKIKNEIINMVKQNGEVEMDKLILSMNYDVEIIKKVIDNLIDEAVIYEPRPGVIKIL